MQVVFQDGPDGAVGVPTDRKRAQAGGHQCFPTIGLGQLEDAEAGTEALLGVGPFAQDHLDQSCCAGPDLGRRSPEPLGRPVGIATVRGGHVLAQRGVATVRGSPQMRCDALALMEDLYRPGGLAHPEPLFEQLMRG